MIKIIKYKSNGTIQANKIFSHKSLQPATTFSDQNFLQLFYLFVPIEWVDMTNIFCFFSKIFAKLLYVLFWIGRVGQFLEEQLWNIDDGNATGSKQLQQESSVISSS